MRSFPFVLPAVLCAAFIPAASAAAQTESQSNLVLTILAGAVTGHHLWTIEKQPLAVVGQPGQFDTLRLARQIGSSIVVGASATYFFSPHAGVHAEISYLGLPVDDDCKVIFDADTTNLTHQVCDDIRTKSGGAGAVSIFTGVTVRAAPQRSLSPYLRANVGIVATTRSTVEVFGGPPPPRLVILDPSPQRVAPLFGVAVGFTRPAGGYQFRLELRDVLTSIERVTGPANTAGIAPTASRYYHHIALTLGLDVVLEKKRGRRY